MESNIKKYNDKRYKISIIENKGKILGQNPFYLVNNFICSNYDCKFLTDNFYKNIFNLTVTKESNGKCLFNYDSNSNTLYSSDSRIDVFALLNVASTDRFKNRSGIIQNNIGYGLNYGITDFYNKKITKDKSFFPFESYVASVINKIDSEALAKSYFEPSHNNLYEIIPTDKYNKFLELIDKYHDNYLKLVKLYRYRFSEERYYFNLIYGDTLRKKNTKLTEIESEINNLENKNYTIVYDVINNLIEFVSNNNNLSNENKKDILTFMNNKFNKLLSKDELLYLNGLSEILKDKKQTKRLVK